MSIPRFLVFSSPPSWRCVSILATSPSFSSSLTPGLLVSSSSRHFNCFVSSSSRPISSSVRRPRSFVLVSLSTEFPYSRPRLLGLVSLSPVFLLRTLVFTTFLINIVIFIILGISLVSSSSLISPLVILFQQYFPRLVFNVSPLYH